MKNTRVVLKPSLALALAVGIVGSLVAGPALAQRYAVTDLGSAGTTSYATAMNNPGQVVGYAYTGYVQEALLWDGAGGVQDLGVAGIPMSINDAGQVVGRSGAGRAFLWDSANGLRDLNTIAGPDGLSAAVQGWVLHEADHVSQNAQIVARGSKGGAPDVYVRWGQDAQGNVLITALDVPLMTVRAINDNGQFAGDHYSYELFAERACVWTPSQPEGTTGVLTDVTPFLGGDSYGFGINSGGQVVGGSQDVNGSQSAFLWTPASPNATAGVSTLLPPLGPAGSQGFTFSEADAINDTGQIVGRSGSQKGLSGVCVWQGHAVFDLMNPQPAGWLTDGFLLFLINNRGAVAGFGGRLVPSGFEPHACILNPRSPTL